MSTITYLSAVDVTPSTASTWEVQDISGSVPVGTTGVMIKCTSTSFSALQAGARHGDDASTTLNGDILAHATIYYYAGVNSSREIRTYAESTTSLTLEVTAYFEDKVKFFSTPVDITPASTGTWDNQDLSSDTGGDTAIGIIWYTRIFEDADTAFGIQHPDSTDNMLDDCRTCAGIIGCNGSEQVEVQTANGGTTVYAVGYITDEATFNTNIVDITPSTINTDEDGSTYSGSLAHIVNVNDGDSVTNEWGAAPDGTATTRDRGTSTAQCVETSSGTINVSVDDATMTVREIGYFEGAAASTKRNNLSLLGVS